MEKKIEVISCVALAIFLSFGSCAALSQTGLAAWNLWTGVVQKVDDSTNYNTRKEVEDTCRAMVSSYESDKLTTSPAIAKKNVPGRNRQKCGRIKRPLPTIILSWKILMCGAGTFRRISR